MSLRSSLPTDHSLGITTSSNSLLPTYSTEKPSTFSLSSLALPRRLRHRPRTLAALLVLGLFLLFNQTRLGTFRRDFVYLIRPLWDTPDPPWTVIAHYPPPTTRQYTDVEQWCDLHGWRSREFGIRPGIIDAVLVNSELDMLEIRMLEYLPYVTTFIIVESNLTFAGQAKPTYFADHRDRFDKLLAGTKAKIVYRLVDDLIADQKKGSFENEYLMRGAVSQVISSLGLPEDTLVIQSDVDEIISRDTLDLLSSCEGFPYSLHLNVANYRYSFQYPIPDDGYWRPHVYTTDSTGVVGYHHSREGDVMLAGAGWHCSFCFPTLEDMRIKMRGYSHNDRVRDPRIMKEESLRGRVCQGEEPFNMWPEAFTFKDMFAQSGALKQFNVFTNVPVAVRDDPYRFGYLLEAGCDRPDH